MSPPLHLLLEFARATDADDPHAPAQGPQTYLLRTEGGGHREAELHWNPALFALLAAVRLPGRDPALVAQLGTKLRRFLGPAGWPVLEERIAKALENDRPVVITIRSSAAELGLLPFELLRLRGTGQHLGELPGVLLRYCWPETQTAPEHPAPRVAPGRILVACSSAAGWVPQADHIEAIAQACAAGHRSFVPARDVCAAATLETLAQALADATAPPVSVLHLLAHGAQVGSVYGLALQDADGGPALVDPARLRQVLAPHAGHLRLVVFAACDSSNAGTAGNALGSLAQAVHRAGIASVVASRFPLSVDGATRLSRRLYWDLLVPPCSLETALRAARTELFKESAELDWASLQLHARPEDGLDTRPLVIRPYRGLLPFGPAHTRFFFGRDAERQEVATDLAELATAGEPRLIVVAGASGTGKSSVVLSGAVPDLTGAGPAEGQDTSDLRRVVGRLEALVPKYDLPQVRASVRSLQDLAGALSSGAHHMGCAVMRPGADPMEALQTALSQHTRPQQPFLLVVDQFEEVFTHTTDPAIRTAFAQALWSLARGESPVHVALTIRVDFLGHCGHIVLDQSGRRLDKIAYDEAHRVFVAQMEAEQLRQCIEAPAQKVGLQLQDGLSDRILQDVGAEPGALPLLSYTLDLLWQQRSPEGMLTQAAYDGLGGVGGALQQKADALVDAMAPDEQHQARRLLVRLVGTSEGGARDTRRRVQTGHIRPSGAGGAVFDGVLATLVDNRLLVRGQDQGAPTVEVAHEALIRKWDRLKDWVDQDREMLAELDEVERFVGPFREYGTLLEGDQLGYARRVLARFPGDVSDSARALVHTSSAALGRRRLLGAGTAQLVFALVSSAAVWGWLNSMAAELGAQSARNALRISAAQAQDADPTTAAVILREAEGADSVTGWRTRAAAVLDQPLATAVLAAGFNPNLAIDWNSGRVALDPNDGNVHIHASLGAEATVLALPPADVTVPPNGLHWAEWAKGGDRLVVEDLTETVSVFERDGDEWKLARVLPQQTPALSLSPNGRWLATGTRELLIWDLDDPGQIQPRVIGRHLAPVDSATWSPDSGRVVTTDLDRRVGVWAVQPGASMAPGLLDPMPPAAPRAVGDQVTWNRAPYNPSRAWLLPRGDQVMAVSRHHPPVLWRLDTGGIDQPDPKTDPEATCMAVSYATGAVAEGDNWGFVRVDGAESGGAFEVRGSGPVAGVWLSPDGAFLAAEFQGAGIEVFDLATHERVLRLEEGPRALGLTDTGLITTTFQTQDHLRLWPLASPVHHHWRQPAQGPDTPVHHARLSGDGGQLLLQGPGGVQGLPSPFGPITGAPPATESRFLVGKAGAETATVWAAGPEGAAPIPGLEDLDLGPGHQAILSPDGAHIVALAPSKPPRMVVADGAVLGADAPVGTEPALWAESVFHPTRPELWYSAESGLAAWNHQTGTTRTVAGDSDGLQDLIISGDGRWIAGTRGEQWLLVWSTAGPQAAPPVLDLMSETPFSAFAFSPDGTRLAVGGFDRPTQVWDLEAPREDPLELRGSGTAGPQILLFDPDSTRLVAVLGLSEEIAVWTSPDGAPDRFSLGVHASALDAAFGPTGRQLVLTTDMAVHVFDLEADLQAALWQASGFCLSDRASEPLSRQAVLGETQDQATARSLACRCTVASVHDLPTPEGCATLDL